MALGVRMVRTFRLAFRRLEARPQEGLLGVALRVSIGAVGVCTADFAASDADRIAHDGIDYLHCREPFTLACHRNPLRSALAAMGFITMALSNPIGTLIMQVDGRTQTTLA